MVRRVGQTPPGDDVVVANALDRGAVHAAVLTAAPDVVVHQLSALRERHGQEAETTARLRTEGTANLITAARAAGAHRFVATSIAFATAPRGNPVLGEDAPLYLDAPDDGWARTVRAVAEFERLVLGTGDLSTTVLRMGMLYGPGTLYARDGAIGTALAAGRFRLTDRACGVTSFVHVDDAAQAVALAVESDADELLNVTDDDPAEAGSWVPHVARLLNGPPPRPVPTTMAARLLGWFTAYQMSELRGASNDRARHALGWKPAHPSWRSGMAE
jgi:nucleoside-diphosphate-sugar epimerase